MKILFHLLIAVLVLNTWGEIYPKDIQGGGKSAYTTIFSKSQSSSRNFIAPQRYRDIMFAGGEGKKGDSIDHRYWEFTRHSFGKEHPSRVRGAKSILSTNPLPLNPDVISSSDSVKIAWMKYYGSDLMCSVDYCEAVATDNKGNIYVTGSTESTPTFFDILTIKFNPNGDVLWQKRYTSDIDNYDYGSAIAVDKNGNVYVSGVTYSFPTLLDYITIKYDSSGNEQWVATYDGPSHDDDIVTCMAVDTSGNVYVGGGSYSDEGSYDYLTVKYNTNGVEQWVRRYDGPAYADDGINALTLDKEGNVYVTGMSNSMYSWADIRTIKYSPDGVVYWISTYDGPASYRDEANAIKVDDSGYVYITGYSGFILIGDEDYTTIKYNNQGILQWAVHYDGGIEQGDIATALDVDISGNVYVGGSSMGVSIYFWEFYTIKYNKNGVFQWGRRENPGIVAGVEALKLDQTGNVVVSGGVRDYINDVDFLTIKYNSNGSKIWQAQYDGPHHHSDYPVTMSLDGLGNIIVVGSSNDMSTFTDYIIVKYSSTDDQLWTYRYDGGGRTEDFIQGMNIDKDGNVYIAVEARFQNDTSLGPIIGLVKYSPNGDTLWTRLYADIILKGMAIDSSGKVCVTGTFNDSSGYSEGIITKKFDPNGFELWSRIFVTDSGTYEARAICIDRIGNIYVGGSSENVSTRNDYIVIKYSSNGDMLWASEHSNSMSFTEEAHYITVDRNSNVAMTGYIGGSGSYTVMFDTEGNLKWSAVGGIYPPFAIAIDKNSNTYITGMNQIGTIKYNSNGEIVWERYDSLVVDDYSSGCAIAIDSEENVFVGGWDSQGDSSEGILLKYDKNGNKQWRVKAPSSGSYYKIVLDDCGNVYAAKSGSNIDLYKYDTDGHEIWSTTFNPFNNYLWRGFLEVEDKGQFYMAGRSDIGTYGLHYATYITKLQAIPNLTLESDTLSLGDVPLTCTGEDTVTLYSTICTIPDVYMVTSSNPLFSIVPIDSTVTTSSIHRYLVRFQPTQATTESSIVTFTHTISNVTTTLSVKGKGVIKYPEYSTQNIQFGDVTVGCNQSQGFTVRNLRCTPLHVSALISDSMEFFVNPESTVVSSLDSINITITFSPLNLGEKSALVTLVHDQNTEPDTILLGGNAVGTGTEVAITNNFEPGWQLISLPIESTCFYILPGSFVYAGSYQSVDTLTIGRGYWNKLKKSHLSFAGFSITKDTITVKKGWNIIGSLSVPFNITSIQTIPDGIIQSFYYGYTQSYGYQQIDSIKPGHAYWIKVNQDGQIVSNGSLQDMAMSQKPSGGPSPFGEIFQSSNSILIEDAKGHRKELYLTDMKPEDKDLEKYELPPAPPEGSFDVRFSTGRILETMSNESNVYEHTILFSGLTYPVHLYRGQREKDVSMTVKIGEIENEIKSDNGVEIIVPVDRIIIQLFKYEVIPTEFSLSQNYPNPFNPITRFDYALPTNEYVTLRIYDALGREVAVIVNEKQEAGYKSVQFDAQHLSSGIYFCRLQAGKYRDVKKMMLLR